MGPVGSVDRDDIHDRTVLYRSYTCLEPYALDYTSLVALWVLVHTAASKHLSLRLNLHLKYEHHDHLPQLVLASFEELSA